MSSVLNDPLIAGFVWRISLLLFSWIMISELTKGQKSKEGWLHLLSLFGIGSRKPLPCQYCGGKRKDLQSVKSLADAKDPKPCPECDGTGIEPSQKKVASDEEYIARSVRVFKWVRNVMFLLILIHGGQYCYRRYPRLFFAPPVVQAKVKDVKSLPPLPAARVGSGGVVTYIPKRGVREAKPPTSPP